MAQVPLTPQSVEAEKRRKAEAEVKRLQLEINKLKREQPPKPEPAAPKAVAAPRAASPAPASDEPRIDPRVTFRTMEPVMQQAGCELCGQMAVLPAGSFVIGSPKTEKDREDGEDSPAQPIRIAAFEIGRSEVTQAQWRAVMNDSPSLNGGCDACPVERVSWNQITGPDGFLARLKTLTGKAYRLPSEAEWEYAARAGSTTAYWWGNAFDSKRANRGPKTLPPSESFINRFGLAHILSNVREFTSDCNVVSLAALPTDGRPNEAVGVCSYVGVRGGSFFEDPRNLRSATRRSYKPDLSDGVIGFRLARTL